MRLIDADALIESWHLGTSCNTCKRDAYKCEYYDKFSVMDVCGMIEDAPTVDAVPVVRCKDCKHWHEETGWCTKHSHFIGCDGMACHPSQSSEWKMFDADYFCKDGERREGE